MTEPPAPDTLSHQLLRRMSGYRRAVPAVMLSSALHARFRSRREHTFGEKVLSAMRFGFGGHIEGNEPIDPAPKRPASPGRSAASGARE
jgi:6-phosphogluconate dehydrogenase